MCGVYALARSHWVYVDPDIYGSEFDNAAQLLSLVHLKLQEPADQK